MGMEMKGCSRKLEHRLGLGAKRRCFPVSLQVPTAAQVAGGKGSSLPLPGPASSPAQPHIWRALRWLQATSTSLPTQSNLTLELLVVDLRIGFPKTNHSPGHRLSSLEKNRHSLHFPLMLKRQLDSPCARYIKKQKH